MGLRLKPWRAWPILHALPRKFSSVTTLWAGLGQKDIECQFMHMRHCFLFRSDDSGRRFNKRTRWNYCPPRWPRVLHPSACPLPGLPHREPRCYTTVPVRSEWTYSTNVWLPAKLDVSGTLIGVDQRIRQNWHPKGFPVLRRGVGRHWTGQQTDKQTNKHTNKLLSVGSESRRN